MLFRWFRRRDPAERAWEELARRLGLERLADGDGMVRDLLDLPGDATVGPVFRVAGAGEIETHVFSYSHSPHTRSRSPLVVTACLLVAENDMSPASWRASRRLHNVLASLQASATGGTVIEVPGAMDFNENVTVVARDAATVESLLTPPVRRVVERATSRLEPPPVLTVGERRILLSAAGTGVAFDAIEFLLSDVMSLYAVLESG